MFVGGGLNVLRDNADAGVLGVVARKLSHERREDEGRDDHGLMIVVVMVVVIVVVIVVRDCYCDFDCHDDDDDDDDYNNNDDDHKHRDYVLAAPPNPPPPPPFSCTISRAAKSLLALLHTPNLTRLYPASSSPATPAAAAGALKARETHRSQAMATPRQKEKGCTF